ncbi:MAG: ABC transporter ATP-binding protein, partial [Actinobacteria bacterium]|nr:ABC transporter ATP-binding protein [Actinomycetota bacterium]
MLKNEIIIQKTSADSFKSNNEYMLEVNNLKIYFDVPEGEVKAVDDISFELKKGEIIGLVGESGCGKSVTALSILKLINHPGRIVSGNINYLENNLIDFNENQMRKIRGKNISMIFQDSMTSLNPLLSIGTQLTETILSHEKVSKTEAYNRAVMLLKETGISSPENRIKEYPHQLSGGMRQRVMISIALACNPDVIIADEPTTALDVTIQAQILDLLKGLVSKNKISVIFITHDLSIIAEMCDKAIIMYAGKIVEEGKVFEIFKKPLHPYTKGLLGSLPGDKKRGEKLFNIKGTVPVPINLPKGCLYYERCNNALKNICNKIDPSLVQISDSHYVYC